MMKRYTACLILALFVGLGCDDGGTTKDAGSNLDAQADTGTGSEGGMPEGGMMDVPENQCTGNDDLAALSREDYGDSGDKTLGDLSSECAVSCLGEGAADIAACVAKCTREASGSAISEKCSVCFGVGVACTGQNCLSAPGNCLESPEASECLQCQCGEIGPMVDCLGLFDTCLGVPSGSCD